MAISIIRDPDKYFNLIHDILSDNGIISDPKQLYGLIKLSVDHDGQITGWEIEDREIKFVTNDFMDCDEGALLKGDRFEIRKFSYHFKPYSNEELFSYRIDLKFGDLHFNTDISLKDYYGDHLKPYELSIDIENFNCLLAILLALMYISKSIYPADSQASAYENALGGMRRRLV